MPVILDGHSYNCFQTNYQDQQTKFADTLRSLTGQVIRLESNVFDTRYPLKLICTPDDINNLRISYAKATFANDSLDFIDEEGNHWNPNASGDGILNTGVYFDGIISPQPMTPRGWSNGNRFTVDILLIVNSAVLLGAGENEVSFLTAVPGGTIDGVNATFTLPVAVTSLVLVKNQGVLTPTVDYTYVVSGTTTITIASGQIPVVSDTLLAIYTI